MLGSTHIHTLALVRRQVGGSHHIVHVKGKETMPSIESAPHLLGKEPGFREGGRAVSFCFLKPARMTGWQPHFPGSVMGSSCNPRPRAICEDVIGERRAHLSGPVLESSQARNSINWAVSQQGGMNSSEGRVNKSRLGVLVTETEINPTELFL